ncbi:MAG: mechanosensitive ion channel family protein [Myxococcales bacterium]|nr:mechanosensitive ion channel family protein [Myxococcales bacterium]MBL0195146.1 mechanosensitive ion channel family protein [Myxococcales bacterium]
MAKASAFEIGLKLIAALLMWIVGVWLIAFVDKIVGKSLKARKVEETLTTYISAALTAMLKIALALGVLGYLGVQTTTFAALLGAAGVAIGMAWSGLLAHFAAGAFLVVLRPFKVGDFVEAGGVTGTVEEVGLFVTKINTMDNVATLIGNSKVFGDTIKNYTANKVRRVELTAQLDHTGDTTKAIEILKEALSKIPNVASSPAPEVNIVTFTLAGPVLSVRPYCHNDHYWQVYFETNAAIRNELGKAGYAVPQQHLQVMQPAKAA